jgi:hypothetical protein
MDKEIRWVRVLHQGRDRILCWGCFVDQKATLLNRVFGASQTCEVCGKSDKKGAPIFDTREERDGER